MAGLYEWISILEIGQHGPGSHYVTQNLSLHNIYINCVLQIKLLSKRSEPARRITMDDLFHMSLKYYRVGILSDIPFLCTAFDLQTYYPVPMEMDSCVIVFDGLVSWGINIK